MTRIYVDTMFDEIPPYASRRGLKCPGTHRAHAGAAGQEGRCLLAVCSPASPWPSNPSAASAGVSDTARRSGRIRRRARHPGPHRRDIGVTASARHQRRRISSLDEEDSHLVDIKVQSYVGALDVEFNIEP